MIEPTIHLNGTSREALHEGYIAAGQAVRQAILALAEAAPHERDYYPQGDDAYKRAMAEHNARAVKLGSVLEDLIVLIGVTA